MDEHEGQRVSRRRLITGIGVLSFGGVLAAKRLYSGAESLSSGGGGGGPRGPGGDLTPQDTLNDNDNIYEDSMLMKVTEDGDGYLGVIVFSADSDRDGA